MMNTARAMAIHLPDTVRPGVVRAAILPGTRYWHVTAPGMFDPPTLLPNPAVTPIPVAVVPVATVNGIVKRNWPPVAVAVVFANQVVKAEASGASTSMRLVCNVLPAGAVKLNVPLSMLRVLV